MKNAKIVEANASNTAILYEKYNTRPTLENLLLLRDSLIIYHTLCDVLKRKPSKDIESIKKSCETECYRFCKNSRLMT